MKRSRRPLLKPSILPLLFFCALSVTLVSCGPVDEKLPEKTTTSTGYTPPSSTTVDDSSGFNVVGYYKDGANVTRQYFLHQDKLDDDTSALATSFSTSCMIATNAADATDPVDCILEANEEDLFSRGATLQVNVPSTMCSYFTKESYFFSAFQSGTGPGYVSITRDVDNNITAWYACAGNADCGTPGNVKTGKVDAATGTINCIYDYSSATYGFAAGKNCCTGSYVLKDGANAPATVSWGGSAGNCLAGPAMTDSNIPKDSATGIPLVIVVPTAGTGTVQKLEVKAPIDDTFFGHELHSNLTAANFVRDTDGDFNRTFADEALPTFSGLVYRSPYYTFTCYDENLEIKQQIRLVIRSWDQRTNYQTMHTAVGVAASSTTYDTADVLRDIESFTGSGYTYIQDHWGWYAATRLSRATNAGAVTACGGVAGGSCANSGFQTGSAAVGATPTSAAFYHIGAVTSSNYPGVCMLWPYGFESAAATTTYGCRGVGL